MPTKSYNYIIFTILFSHAYSTWLLWLLIDQLCFHKVLLLISSASSSSSSLSTHTHTNPIFHFSCYFWWRENILIYHFYFLIILLDIVTVLMHNNYGHSMLWSIVLLNIHNKRFICLFILNKGKQFIKDERRNKRNNHKTTKIYAPCAEAKRGQLSWLTKANTFHTHTPR